MRLLKLVPDDTNIHFLKWRVPFYVVSCLLIAASWALVLTKGLNYGVDFAGGQEIRATFTQEAEAPIAELRDTVGALGYGEPTIQRFGAPNEVSIRVKLPESATGDPGAAEQISRRIISSIEQAHPDVRVDGVDTVSGKVSGEFRSTALYALLAAMLAISIYIWVRFEWQFGVGALIPRKGQRFVVEALAELPDTQLVLVGTGPDRSALEELVRTRGLDGRVHFLGSLDHGRLPVVLSSADAMVLPSASEGLANAWVEALACGTPLVITDAGGARELVTGPEAGSIVERDAGAIAGAVRVLLAEPPERKAVAAFAEKFSWEANAAALAAYYEGLVV